MDFLPLLWCLELMDASRYILKITAILGLPRWK